MLTPGKLNAAIRGHYNPLASCYNCLMTSADTPIEAYYSQKPITTIFTATRKCAVTIQGTSVSAKDLKNNEVVFSSSVKSLVFTQPSAFRPYARFSRGDDQIFLQFETLSTRLLWLLFIPGLALCSLIVAYGLAAGLMGDSPLWRIWYASTAGAIFLLLLRLYSSRKLLSKEAKGLLAGLKTLGARESHKDSPQEAAAHGKSNKLFLQIFSYLLLLFVIPAGLLLGILLFALFVLITGLRSDNPADALWLYWLFLGFGMMVTAVLMYPRIKRRLAIGIKDEEALAKRLGGRD